MQRAISWLRVPRRRWLRVPVALLLLCGGLLWFMPLLGLWMLPLGLVLLSEDVPMLRRPMLRALGWVQAQWDRWRERSSG